MVINRNNKGYMLIEIIMAAVIGVGIAIFIVSLVIKIKNKNDDAVVASLTTTDTTIVTNKLMEYAIEEKEKFDCSKLILTDKTLKYDEDIVNVFNDYVDLSDVNCSNKNGKISIFIPVDVVQIPSEDYDIEIDYKYIVGSLSYPYIKVETDNPTEYSKSKKINFIVGSSSGLLGGTYRIKYKWSTKKLSCNDIDDSSYVDIKVNDKDTEASLSDDKLVEINGDTGKGKVYACNTTPISDYEKQNVLPETIASQDAYLDNKAPTCTLTNGSGKVYFSKKEDADSGVLEYGINKTKDSPIYDKTTHDDNSKRLEFKYNTKYYGYVKDKAGNEGTCSASWSPPPSSGGGGGGGGGCDYCCQCSCCCYGGCGGGGGSSCFMAGTKVITPYGLRNIEDIKVGDLIYSKNMTTNEVEIDTVKVNYKRVSHENIYVIYDEIGYVKTTPDHPFYVKNYGWKKAEDLDTNDILIDLVGNDIQIKDIKIISNINGINVYNLQATKNHNYFVGMDSILVHNRRCFVKGTKILSTLNGTYKSIEDIKVGDKVVTYDAKNNKNVESIVTETYTHKDVNSIVKITFEDNSILEMTMYHPLYTKSGWKSITGYNNYDLLSIGDEVKTINGWKKIINVNVSMLKENIDTYTIKVQDSDSYYANEILAEGMD